MSENILKALMRLFAIIAVSKEQAENSTLSIVEGFLRHEVSVEQIAHYMDFYNRNYKSLKEKAAAKTVRKFIASASTKILVICEAINKELLQRQKVLIIVRLLEFIKGNKSQGISAWEKECVETVAQKFNIPENEYKNLTDYVFMDSDIPCCEDILVIDGKLDNPYKLCKHIYNENLSGEIIVFSIKSVRTYLFVFRGERSLTLNGQMLNPERVHIFSPGSSIRGGKINPVYYSDVVSTFNFDKSKTRISFEADKVEYIFSNGTYGLHPMSFLEKSGKLVGIMGVSGAGKTTLMNVLNGNQKPTKGHVLINGIDLHDNNGELDGLIGYVSQDDLLIEELTVFQNLYYAAKQCFSNYSRFRLYRIVLRLLNNLGLYEVRNMAVGSPLNKRISGGQRKRLNIALELIREPSVLFLDEPTSGLSSMDSQNIMDLLKELSIKGNLVFVVIHQPSSDIFKMFDNLILLDTGGYLIYKGDPVEAVTYFKSCIKQADSTGSECPTCGNVNSEQIFNIIESKIIDDSGCLTQTRRISPKQWNDMYIESEKKKKRHSVLVKHLPKVKFKIPNIFSQFLIFVKRDVLAKLSNKQYVSVNFLESPLIAVILSFIIKYYNLSAPNGYTLSGNGNLPIYLFIATIVAVFVGLTVSAQEIIKDRLIRKREAFLNLSKGAYLSSKVAVLFFISAYQSFMFVLIGNGILEIHDMNLKYFFMLFAVWLNANLMGLNISDAFKTTVTIYILIPFLIIPQIALSGVLISFDKLNPAISTPGRVPWYGDLMVSRWAFEGLAVEQFKNNVYEAPLYAYEKQMQYSLIKKDFWLTVLENKVAYYERNFRDIYKKSIIDENLKTLRNEIASENSVNKTVKADFELENLCFEKINEELLQKLKTYFQNLRSYYTMSYKEASSAKDTYVTGKQATENSKEVYLNLKRRYYNEALAEFVTSSKETDRIVEYENRIYQKTNPVYLDPQGGFLKSHFYSPVKNFLGYRIETFWANLCVIWIITVILYITLYFGILRKILLRFDEVAHDYDDKCEEKMILQGQANAKNRRKKISDLKIFR